MQTPRRHAQIVCLDHGDVCISHGFYDRSQLRIMPETMPRCRVPHHRYRCHSHPTWMPAICHKRTRAQLFVCTKHVRRMLGRVRGAATPRTRRFRFDSARKRWTTRSQVLESEKRATDAGARARSDTPNMTVTISCVIVKFHSGVRPPTSIYAVTAAALLLWINGRGHKRNRS